MENKKENNTLLIVVIVVISLLLVGTLAYFAYDKIFKEDKPVEENKDNKDNTNNDNKGDTDDDGVEVVDYGNKHFIRINFSNKDIVIKNFNFDNKNNELRLKFGDYNDNSKEQIPMSIYLNNKLVTSVKIFRQTVFEILDYNNYYVISASGDLFSHNLFVLSSNNKVEYEFEITSQYDDAIDFNAENFNGIISKKTYKKKDNYMIEENIEKIDLNEKNISSKSSNEEISCKVNIDEENICRCWAYFDIDKGNHQCS